MNPLIEKLLATGAMSGPHKRTRPFTLTRRMRFLRWLRKTFDLRSNP